VLFPYLEILSHTLRNNAQPNAREIVNGKPRIFRNIHREHPFTGLRHFRILKSLSKRLQPHTFHHLPHHYLDENPTATCRIVLVDFYTLKDCPGDRVRCEEVTKESSNIPETIGLITMDRGIVVAKCRFKTVRPYAVKLGETFANEAVESRVGPFLRATFNNHVD
jgi:hypothetical protein